MHLDLSKLVSETFSYKRSNDHDSFDDLSVAPTRSPGVIYSLHKTLFYTSIRCSESPNLFLDFQDKDKWSDEDDINFFETKSFYDAKSISKEFDNFKFYRKPEAHRSSAHRIWYLRYIDKINIEILFDFQAPEFGNYVTLGALGDASLARHYFEQMGKYCSGKVGLKKMKILTKSLVFSFDNHVSAREFKNFVQFMDNEKIDHLFSSQASSSLPKLSIRSYFYERLLAKEFWDHLCMTSFFH